MWDADTRQFPASRLFLVHARSAYRDEGIVVENNMPFYDEDAVFIFNGELHGVRIKEEGRIGAEKIFRVIKRFYRSDLGQALRQGGAHPPAHAGHARHEYHHGRCPAGVCVEFLHR